ncbi:hypothetical protein [Solihabitans fulvus]|uniref:hypothetical protein n=1 Tax=Solihabitans fulvus TaxID=1892852 RepID=UPI001CB76384|nr:hypothetical protein [Solihabitans fulvus]
MTADLPIRVKALPFADRVEIRLGKAFPAVLLVDRDALSRLGAAISEGAAELGAANKPRAGDVS